MQMFFICEKNDNPHIYRPENVIILFIKSFKSLKLKHLNLDPDTLYWQVYQCACIIEFAMKILYLVNLANIQIKYTLKQSFKSNTEYPM